MARLMGGNRAAFLDGGEILSASGAFRVALLVKVCNSNNGRAALAKKSGIDNTLLLKWVKMAERRAVDSDRSVYLLKISDVKAIKQDFLRGAEQSAVKTGRRRSEMK